MERQRRPHRGERSESKDTEEEEVVVTAVLCRSGSRNGFRWLLTGHRTPPSNFFQNSATFRSPTSALRFLFSLRAPASPREIPFLFPIRGHRPSFAGPKTQKKTSRQDPKPPRFPRRAGVPPAIERLQPAGTPTSIFFQNSALLRLRALLSSVVKNSALFPLSSFKPRSGILRGNPPGSGRSFF